MALHSDRERYSRCKGRNLELQIWKLGVRYRTALNAMGCPRVIEIKLELAIQYIIYCLSHRIFRNRLQLTYRSRNDKFESSFNHYMRQLAKRLQQWTIMSLPLVPGPVLLISSEMEVLHVQTNRVSRDNMWKPSNFLPQIIQRDRWESG